VRFFVFESRLFPTQRNPIILAIVGGVLFSLTGWPLPSYLNSFCTYTGDAVTPMAAFAIGVFACRYGLMKNSL
jgi:predicted permease